MKTVKQQRLRRLLASRANSLSSTGPRTPEGKQKVANNATTHGLTAQTLLLPGESADRFQELLAGFEADLQPQNTVDRFHVEQLAAAAWRIRRAQVFESNLVCEALAARPAADPAPAPARAVTTAWADSRAHLAARYETTHHRHFRHHLAELRENQTTRLRGDAPDTSAALDNQSTADENQEIRNKASLENATPESECPSS